MCGALVAVCCVNPTEVISIDFPAYGSLPLLGYECVVVLLSWSQVNAIELFSKTTPLPTPNPCCPTFTTISPVNAL